MSWKKFFSFLFFLVVLFLLVFYFFVPFNEGEFFASVPSTSNFSISGDAQLQFYENMRFTSKDISYRIDDCTLQKEDDMIRAFEIVEEKTILNFESVNSGEEIYVTCSSKNKIEGSLVVAGEGGPTNITKAGDFNVIFGGSILLLRDSQCPEPNVGVHELFHVLGFNHSENPTNIMYPVSKCSQEISGDMIDLVDELYSIPSEPDLVFEDISAEISGRYLSTEFTLRNFGLGNAGASKVLIYVDEKLVKEIDVGEIQIGFGRTLTLQNIFVPNINVEELEFVVENDFKELNKENNKVNLKIKN